jgi:predicted outer membrane repeat protein
MPLLLAALLVAGVLSPLLTMAAPPPGITVVSISRDAANPVAPGAALSWTVTFSAPIDPFTVDPSGFTVLYDDGTPGNPTGGLVPINSATLDPSGTSITVVPVARSGIGTYTLTVVGGPLAGLDGSPVTGVPVSGGTYTMASIADVWVGSTADGAPRPAPDCTDRATSDCTLREAIATATSGQDSIRFRPTVTGAIVLDQSQGTLNLTQSVVILGPDATVLAVDGGNHLTIFHVFGSPTIALSGLTLRHGNAGESYGGALAIEGGTITLAADVFTSNTAGGAGGAIASRGGATLGVTNSTFSDNHSTTNNGGAIDSAFSGANLVVTDSTFTANTAPLGDGGAINNYQGTATLTNVTLANNGPNESVASWTADGVPATTNLTNVVVANNGNGAADLASIGGGVFTGSNNLTDDGSGSLITGGTGTITGKAALLGTLGAFGGPTQTVPLLPGSPAIDAGSCAAGYHDQRSIAQVGVACDIGAFESQGFTLTITGGNAQSTPVGAPFPLPLTLTVAANNPAEPVQGGQVTYIISPVGGAAAILSANTATIDGTGGASVTATANNVPGGPHGVVARATGALSVELYLLNTNPLVRIAVTGPPSGTMKVGEMAQFHATAIFTDGTQRDITNTVGWSTSDATIAGVDSTGNVTAKAAGTVTITASITAPAGIGAQAPPQGHARLTVGQPTLTGVQPGPAPASRPGGAALPGGTAKPAPAPLPPSR